MYLPQKGDNCVQSAVSVIRTVLGYPTAFPKGIKLPIPTPTKDVLMNAQKFFPDHKIAIFVEDYELITEYYKDVRPKVRGFSDLEKKGQYEGKYIYMFDYNMYGSNYSHTVVGLPSWQPGLRIGYAIRVSL